MSVTALFGRLLWKEYRVQRAFWLSVIATPILFSLFSLPLGLYLAFWVPPFYALGCAAVLFAGEKEERTFEQLQVLPVSPGQLIAAKLGFALLSTAAMLVVLYWGCALAMTLFALTRPDVARFGGHYVQWNYAWSVFDGSLRAVHFLAWGTFFSLLCRRVLPAVVLTSLWFVILLRGSAFLFRSPLPILLADGLALGASIWLARGWLNGHGRPARSAAAEATKWWKRDIRLARSDSGDVPVAQGATASSRTWGTRLFRMVWQEYRHARPIAIAWLALAGLLLLFNVLQSSLNFDLDLAVLVIPLTPLLFGVCTFHGEWRQCRFRFAAERGIAPAALWLSKHLIWIPLTVAAAWLLLQVDLFGERWHLKEQAASLPARVAEFVEFHGTVNSSLMPYLPGDEIDLTAQMWLYVAAAYAAGQLMSLLVSKAVTAFFLAGVLTVFLTGWSVLMDWLNVPFFASITPIGMLLLATFVRTNDWLLERNRWAGWTGWGSVAGVILVPLALNLAGVAYHRIHEIPGGGPGFSVEEFFKPVTADEARTAEMYRRAIERLPPGRRDRRVARNAPGTRRVWFEEASQVLELAAQAASRPNCVISDVLTRDPLGDPRGLNFEALHELFLYSAFGLIRQNRLDEAFDRYMASVRMCRHLATRCSSLEWSFWNGRVSRFKFGPMQWIFHRQQTPERLKAAIATIEREAADFPSLVDSIKVDYVVSRRRQVENLPELIAERYARKTSNQVFLNLVDRCFPWERVRARRLEDYVTRFWLAHAVDAKSSRHDRNLAAWWQRTRESLEHLRSNDGMYSQWQRTTPLDFSSIVAHNFQEDDINRVATTRAFLLTAALVAWRLEHGEFPEQLDQLEGTYFDELPLDPWSGNPFLYDFAWVSRNRQVGDTTIITPPAQPLVWSIGSGNKK